MTGPGALHVVLGTGPLGLAVARRLAVNGRAVKAVNRSGRASLPAEVEVVAADAASVAALRAAVAGASVVYHCANTAYHTWPDTLPPIMAAVIEAAPTWARALSTGTTSTRTGRTRGR